MSSSTESGPDSGFDSGRDEYGDPKTRQRILAVAHDLLISQGASMRLSDVASAAAVSRQALYLHFGNREGLLLSLVSDMDERLDLGPSLDHVLSAGSGGELLERALRLNARFWRAVEPVARVLRDNDDDALQSAWGDRMAFRHSATRAMVERLHELGDLDDEWTVEDAADVLYAMTHLDPWAELISRRGWTDDRYVATMSEVLARTLLTPVSARKPSPTRRRGTGSRR